jgi:hypothetical protein
MRLEKHRTEGPFLKEIQRLSQRPLVVIPRAHRSFARNLNSGAHESSVEGSDGFPHRLPLAYASFEAKHGHECLPRKIGGIKREIDHSPTR